MLEMCLASYQVPGVFEQHDVSHAWHVCCLIYQLLGVSVRCHIRCLVYLSGDMSGVWCMYQVTCQKISIVIR